MLLLAIVVTGHYLLKPGAPTFRPDITLQTISGNSINLSETGDEVLLVNFWATTCVVCLREIPQWITLYREMRDYGLRLIAVSMPYDPPNLVLATVEQFEITYPSALDLDGSVAQAFGGVRATPTSFLIAPGGRIVARESGRTDFTALREEILKLLAAR